MIDQRLSDLQHSSLCDWTVINIMNDYDDNDDDLCSYVVHSLSHASCSLRRRLR